MTTRKEYVSMYYKLYDDGDMVQGGSIEMETIGKFLIENTKGVVLDVGCGPVPQMRCIFMPNATEIHAIDLPQESIDFVKEKLKTKNIRYRRFLPYQKFVEKVTGRKLSEKYILEQIDKIKSIQQGDMTKSLPFPENYFDAITALYSLGTLKNEEELKDAIANFHKLLKTGGKFLHTNTNGTNANNILPEYTWRGLSQKSGVIKEQLKKFDFTDIIEQTIKVNGDGIYKFNTVSVICSTKK